jgi:acetolactate synthase small subunit
MAAFLLLAKEEPMRCTFRITTAPQPRVLARVVQLFDQQLIVLQSPALKQTEHEIRIRISADVSPALADRIRAKMLHLLAVEDVKLEISSIS